MKKNLRIVSAAAAALLAVAPVAASAVNVNADVVPGGEVTNTNKPDNTKKNEITFSSSLNSVDYKTSEADLIKDSYIMSNLKVDSPSGSSIVGLKGTMLAQKDKDGKFVQVHSMTAGETYYLVTEATINGLSKDTDTEYTLTNSAVNHSSTAKPTNQGTLTNIEVAIKFNAVDKNAKGNPFFAGLANGTNKVQTYSDNQNVPASTKQYVSGNVSDLPDANSVANIKAIVKAMGLAAYNDSQDTTNRLTEADVNDAIDAQLKADKVVDENGNNFNMPAKGWTLKLSYTNPVNGKVAHLNIVFKGNATAQYSAYPLIKSDVNKTSSVFADVKQGENNFENAMGMVNVPVGTKDWASKVISHFTAQQSTANKSYLRLTTDNLSSSDINTTKPGLYNATLTATNSDGLKTTLHFNVAVTGSVKDLVETKTVLGSNNEVVRLVSIVDGKVSYLSGDVVNQGQSINVYTNDTKTVDGVSYTRVVKDGVSRENNNEWIPTENVVESKKTQKTILHAAYEYDANHKRVGTKVLGAYKEVTVVGDKTQLSDGTPVYKLENGNYVDARNVDPTAKTLTHNAYIYKSNGKAYTYKKTVKKGKKHVKKTYHKVIKKGTSQDVWGGKFKKVGKLTNVYRIGKNQYVKAGNFGE